MDRGKVSEGDEKWELLSKIIDKLESRETKKALARNGITPVNKAIKMLKDFWLCSLN